MSERHNQAAAAYKLKSVAERNSLSFIELEDCDFEEREPLYQAAQGDDAYYQLLLADMLFEQSDAYAKLTS
jgi:hypothetical protein